MGCSYIAMKPTAPLLALPCSGMKPSSPLRAMKGHFWGISTLQRCCRFQWGAQCGLQRCCRFQLGRAAWCAKVLAVSKPPSSRPVHEKVRPARPRVGVSAKKFALHAQNTPKSAFLRLLGEFFRGRAAGGAVLGEFFRANWPCVDLGCDAVHFRLAAMGVLRHAKPSDGVSPACRRLGWRHSPRLVAVRPRCLMCAQQCRT